jgi:glutathione S-transferase
MYQLITANRNYSSWSLRPWLLMTELGIAFDDRLEPFTAPSNYDEFRAFSPTGQVPVLNDGQRTVHDSLGIALYLADRHAGVWPDDEAARAWAQSAVCEMHGGFGALRNDCTMNVGVRVRANPPSPALARDLARITELWSEGITRFGGPFLAGPKFTVADAFFAPVAWRVRTYALDVGAAGQAWTRHIITQPGMQAWEAAALAESWREESHEADLQACGAIISDFRHG